MLAETLNQPCLERGGMGFDIDLCPEAAQRASAERAASALLRAVGK